MATKPNDLQTIKTRDDPAPVVLSRTSGASPDANGPQFRVDGTAHCSWAKSNGQIGPDRLRPRIEPWLTSLVQSEHLSLLVGSGLTHAVHCLAKDKNLPGMSPANFSVFEKEIKAEAKRTASSTNRGDGNFEDGIRAANDLLRGLTILAAGDQSTSKVTNEDVNSLKNEVTTALGSFFESILRGEHSIMSAEENKRQKAFIYLTSFLMSFASRAGTRERLQIFTTNYDRLIEAGADLAGLRLVDRFVGALTPVFRASRLEVDLHYDPPGIRGEPRYLEGVARFTKLHGSVDWMDCDRAIRRIGLPFGTRDASDAQPYLNIPGFTEPDVTRVMIHPNAAKDRETTDYPYVELFRDFAAALCRPNSTLFSYGYSFGDEHVNRIIEDMLTIPSTHLVIISYDDPLDRIMGTYERLGKPAQITLLIGNHLGDLRSIVDHYLPKPAIDLTTSRMAKLLKERLGTLPTTQSEKEETAPSDRGGISP